MLSATYDEATTVPIAASTDVVELFAANHDARQRCVYNSSTSVLYLQWGPDASSTPTVKIPPDGLYEFPTSPLYRGLVTGVWETADGAAWVTEFRG